MKLIRTLVFACVASATPSAGCQTNTPVGTAGASHKYGSEKVDLAVLRVPPPPAAAAGNNDGALLLPGQLQARLLVDASDAVLEVRDMALTSQHLYFAVSWEGVYRVPKHGGPAEVLEANTANKFVHLDTLSDEVFWARSQFDAKDYPSLDVRRLSDAGGAIGTVFATDWGIGETSTSTFEVDAQGVYFLGHPAGAGTEGVHLYHVPMAGGAPARIKQGTVPWPNWLRDEGRIFFAESGFTDNATKITVLRDGQTETQILATLPQRLVQLKTMDASSLYLSDGKTLWQVAKADGAIKELVHDRPVGQVLVDATHIYFTSIVNDVPVLQTIVRADGSTSTLASGRIFAFPRQMEQDNDLIYVLHEGKSIWVVAKAPVL